MSREKTGAGLFETIRTVIYAVLIALVIRTVAYEPFNIPSGSMIPTLLVGDYLFVSKFSYGYSKHSLPFSVPLFPGRIAYSMPERGDVAVFKLPRDGQTDYIKRVVGLPGDRIQVRDGLLHINGESVKRERIDDYPLHEPDGGVRLVSQYLETLPNGRTHPIIELTQAGPLDNTPVYEVPEGHFFMMGDNRDSSLDSRVVGSVGFVPAENLVGRAEVLFFSVNGRAAWWQVWNWPWAVRFDRLFDTIN
ncbi:MAG: signal peptidase I [Acetobacterales bacterium]